MINNIKTILLLGILSVMLVLLGSWIGGQSGLYFGLLISIVMNIGAYFFSDKLALSASQAEPISQQQAPEIYDIVHELAGEMNIPMPKLYMIPAAQANAFATGRDPNHASVAVTEGILDVLDREELKAVLAHELGHVRNRDILIASVAAVLASATTFMARIGMYGGFGNRDERNKNISFLGPILALLAPVGAAIVQLAVSRQREYEADETGAETLHDGRPLASALQKISQTTRAMPMTGINPAISSLYIANPLGGMSGLANLFSTHPPVEDRIKRLLAMRF